MNRHAYLVIPAIGEGKRMQAFTFNGTIPKCLLSAGNKTIIESIIDSYKDTVSNVIIICREEHVNMISAILDYKHVDADIVALPKLTVSPIESLYYGLQRYFDELGVTKDSDFFDNVDFWINWSDVWHKDITEIDTYVGVNNVFLDTKYVHRNLGFETNDGKFIASTVNQKGNVPGIFNITGKTMHAFLSIENIESLHLNDINDFDRLICNNPLQFGITEFVYFKEPVIDTGDYLKYVDYMHTQSNAARYFNEISIGDKYVYKRPKTEKGRSLHEIELKFYRKYGSQTKSFCKLVDYDIDTMTMTLEKIKGVTCQKYFDSHVSEKPATLANKLLKKFDNAISEIHAINIKNKPTHEQELSAAWEEFVGMIDKRVKPCLPLIDNVIQKHNITSIDGMPITRNYDKLVYAVDAWFMENKESLKFGICHGDPNTDNSMIESDGTIRFIDPRGFFGNLDVLGWSCIQYDYAKFAYGLSGYSRFTNSPYIAIRIENGNVKTYTGVHEIEGLTNVSIFDMKLDDITRVLIGIIWTKLTSYIINSPTKSVLAYLYGNALLTKLLKIE